MLNKLIRIMHIIFITKEKYFISFRPRHFFLARVGPAKKLPRGQQMWGAGVLLCPRARFWRPALPSKCLTRQTPLSPHRPLHIRLKFCIDAASNFKRATQTQWCLTREAFGGQPGPSKPCMGIQQNTRAPHLWATWKFVCRFYMSH